MELDPVQELHLAAELGDLEKAQYVLQWGVAVDSQDYDCNTALHIAAANDHEDVMRFLVEVGANPELCNHMGWTPLMQAARHGHLATITFLLRLGVAVDARNRLGMTALMLASVSGHMPSIRALLDAGARLHTPPSLSTCQVSPLMVAAHHGNDAVVRLFLDKGVNANKATPKSGITPLMFGAAGGNVSTAQILLDRGADANVTSACHLTALHVARSCNRPDIAAYLQKKTTNKKKSVRGLRDVMQAARHGNTEAVREILYTEPGQCHTTTSDGATPLMVAAMMGHRDVAQLLLQYGTHIDAQDHKNGWTALMQAIYHRQTDMAKFLIHCGAEINIATPKGYTAGDFAGEMLDVDILKLLMEEDVVHLQQKEIISSACHTEVPSKHSLKQWWNRVSNRFHKVKYKKGYNGPPDDLETLDVVTPMEPIPYEPIFPHETRLPPIMDFNGGGSQVRETMMSMLPPHISPNGGRPGQSTRTMPPGRKIVPSDHTEPPRHTSTTKILKNNQGSGSSSPSSSFNMPSLQSSYESKCMECIPQLSRGEIKNCSTLEQDLLVLSMDSYASNSSSLKMSSSSKSSHTTVTLTPAIQDKCDTDPLQLQTPELNLSLRSCELTQVLHRLNLQEYLELFHAQDVDLEAFLELSNDDLHDLGIDATNSREIILKAITTLKNKMKT
ncbi:ankyrin repeat and SAM domain-containing protein 6-like [Oratosquilla oratoria]|uniref:ankyrin repeat and SAM domain-containing protein 6-like n=1 Tax=Oratosquilla oratoria TaxID=337810 RepID=UPI003F75D521